MRIPTFLTTLIACVLLLAIPAATAWANATDDRIVSDCQNSPTGALRGSYSQQQLNHALHNLPSDINEYSGCSEAIAQAMQAGAGHDGGSGGGTDGTRSGGIGGGASGGGSGGTGDGGTGASGTGAPAPEAQPPAGAERPVDVAGAAIAPGALPEIGKDSHRLPTGLLVLLVLLGVAALVPATMTIGRRVAGRRGP